MGVVARGAVALGERSMLDGTLLPLRDLFVAVTAQFLGRSDQQVRVLAPVGLVAVDAAAVRHRLVNHRTLERLPQVAVALQAERGRPLAQQGVKA